MKNAVGGYFNLTILALFIIFVSGFLAIAVNYSKAYRVKNDVLTYLEKYEGNTSSQEMLEHTYNYAKTVGYTASAEVISAAENSGYTCAKYNNQDLGWCYRTNSPKHEKFTVDMVVFINVNIPFMNRLFSNIKFFWMTGTTSSIPIME